MDVLIGSHDPLTQDEILKVLLWDQGEGEVYSDGNKIPLENFHLFSYEDKVAALLATWDMDSELSIWSEVFNNGGIYNPNGGVYYRTHQGAHHHGVFTGDGVDNDWGLQIFETTEGLVHFRRMMDMGLIVRFWIGRSASNIVGGSGDGSGLTQALVIKKALAEGEAFALRSTLFPGSGWITEKEKDVALDFVQSHIIEN